MQIQVLGALRASDGDGHDVPLGGRRQRLVLALLTRRPGQAVATDRLVDDVWGDAPPPTARKTLQVYVARLRSALGDGVLESTPDGYRLDRAEVDATVFERLADDGRRALQDDPAAAVATLRSALALWRGRPWGDLADAPALRADADRLLDLRLVALEDRIDGQLRLGGGAELVGELESLVADHPFRERLRELLMLALHRAGRTADALRVYEDVRARLAEELGADPGPSLRDLHRRVLDQDPSLAGPRRAGVRPPSPDATGARNPYKGLRPFGEDDAGDFFGRRDFIAELARRLTRTSFVAVVGPSGAGKSSVVRAGLAPAVRRGEVGGADRWIVATMTPGAHPFAQFEAALVRAAADPTVGDLRGQLRGDDLDVLRATLRLTAPDARVLLIVDQFEELYLQVGDVGERRRFVRNLVEAVEDPGGRLSLVVTLRADMFDRPLADPTLGPLLGGRLAHLTPLTAADLEAACVTPAARAGVAIEPELAAELVAAVVDRPAALPHFQFTLTELFDARRGDAVTLHDYEALGGLHGVVARRAEQAFGELDGEGQETARRALLRLVVVGEGGELARRRATRAELGGLDVAPDVLEVVLQRFGEARLLAFDRDPGTEAPTVEVAHEALLEAWPRLAAWIDENRADLALQRSIRIAATDWDQAGRGDDYLLAGARLDRADEWLRTSAAPASALERAFIDASLRRRREDAEREEARRRRELDLQRRAANRLRYVVAVLAVAVAVAGTLSAVALAERREADLRRDDALAAAQLLRAQQLAGAAVANRLVDPQLGLLLALHSVNVTAQAGLPLPEESVDALHWTLQAARVPYPGDAPAAVREGPAGPQGVFLLPADELVGLARRAVERDLTDGECERYLATTGCPELPAEFPALQEATGIDPRTGSSLAGTTVAISGAFPDENGGLAAELAALHDRTGIHVEYTGLIDPEGIAGDLPTSRRPPDLVVVPWPGAFAPGGSLAADRVGLQDLSAWMDADETRAAMSAHLVSLGTVGDDGAWPADDGAISALPLKLVHKSLIYYPDPAFREAGYEIPTTLDELVALTERIAADGRTPWCVGLGSGAASGWPGTDVLENLLLHGSPDAYDAWIRHDIGFADAEVRRAFERMARLWLRPGHVLGGPAAAARLDFGRAPLPLLEDPPGCWLHAAASFTESFLPDGAGFGRGLGVFRFPREEVGSIGVVGAGDYIAALADRPEVREVLRALTGPDSGREWAARDPGYLSARRDFPLDAYVRCGDAGDCEPDAFRRRLAEDLTSALATDSFRFDGSDLLPQPIGSDRLFRAMVAFVGQGPDNLDQLLTQLDAAWDDLAPPTGDGGG